MKAEWARVVVPRLEFSSCRVDQVGAKFSVGSTFLSWMLKRMPHIVVKSNFSVEWGNNNKQEK
jgi:hypothetical protein